jgi:hypothetical protein
MAIPDFTSQQEALLKEVAALQAQDAFVTMTQVNNAITNNGALFKASPTIQTVTLASGVATIERFSQINHVALATEGGATSDELTSITTTGFVQGDFLVLYTAQTGTSITAATVTNLLSSYFVWRDTSNMLLLVFDGTNFVELGRYPTAAIKAVSQANYTIPDTGIQTITVYTEWCKTNFLDLATEVLATGSVTVTAAAGASGSLIAYVDNGSGVLVELGRTNYTVASSANAQAAALNAAINALTATHGYSSTVLLNVVTITAPAGSGATANAWLIETEVAGGMTATNVDFAAGVDASEANGTLDDINGYTDGMEIVLTNVMAGNTITLTALGNIASPAANVLAAGASQRMIYDSTISAWTLYA